MEPFFQIYNDSDGGIWDFGFLIASALVLCSLLHLLIDLRAWVRTQYVLEIVCAATLAVFQTYSTVTSIVLSILVFYGFALSYNALADTCCSKDPPYWIAERLVMQADYWFALLLIVVLALFPR